MRFSRRDRSSSIMLVVCSFMAILALTPTTATAQIDTLPGFNAQLYATVDAPFGLAFAPSGSVFGSDLYVSSITESGTASQTVNDLIYTVSPTGAVTLFATLLPEADPLFIRFPPSGSAFGDFLYVSANNRDNSLSGDCGGAIQQVDSAGSVVDFTSLTSTVPCGANFSTALTEPVGFKFAPGGAFGTDIYIANSNNPPADIHTVDPSGAVSNFLDDGIGAGGLRPEDVAFGPGGAFGIDLYFADRGGDPACGGNCLRTVDSLGTVSAPITTFAGSPSSLAFGPGGAFGTDLYVKVNEPTGGKVYTVDATGTATLFADGFLGVATISFSPDGSSLFVADATGNAVYEITPDTVSIDITETIAVDDVPMVTVIPLAVQINVNETIAVSDTPALLPAALIVVNEGIVVSDNAGVTPPAVIAIVEEILVTDLPGTTIIPVAQINVTETIQVSDSPSLLPAAWIVVNEAITVADAPQVTPPAIITVAENILVADAPNVVPPAVIALTETIAVSDLPGILPSVLIEVAESILVGEVSEFLPSAVIDILELIDVADAVDVPNTRTGQDVEVPLQDPATGATATVTFDNVTVEGNTTLVSTSSGPSVPLGFAPGDPPTYYDISTSASFTDNVEVCIDYAGVTYHDESHLGLFHYEGALAQNITTTVDAVNDTVCGVTSSLSVFAIFEAQTRPLIAVFNEKDDTVSLINAETNQLAGVLGVGDKPTSGAFVDFFSGAPPARLYVSQRKPPKGSGNSGGQHTLQVLFGPQSPSPATALDIVLGGPIGVGKQPRGAAISPDGSQLWVAVEKDNLVVILDVATHSVLASVPLTQGNQKLGKNPVALAFSANGVHAYVVGNKSDNLIVLDTTLALLDPANAIVSSVGVGKKPTALSVASGGSLVYVATGNKDLVAVVDMSFPAAPLLLATVPVGKRPEGLTLTPDGDKLYVTNSKSDTVSVFEVVPAPLYLSPVTTVPVGKRPMGVAAVPEVSFDAYPYVYVANRKDDTVSVIDTTLDLVIATIPVGKNPRGVAAGAMPALPPPQ